MNPFGVGVAAVVVMAGIGLLLFGIILCVMSLKLKDIHNLVIQTEN